jgi:hypothetical protein
MEPYKAPTASSDSPRIRRRWGIFLITEFVLVCVAFYLFFEPHYFRWVGIAFGIVGTWLGFTLPIAFLYLIGKPPVMSLAPLLSSREARAYQRELQARRNIDDNAFLERFYSQTDVPRDIPIRLRRLFVQELDSLFLRMHPEDQFVWLVEDIDLSPFIRMVEREFAVTLTHEVCAKIDTFDWLVRYIAVARNPIQPTNS